MQIELDNESIFSILSTLRNAISTFELFIENQCETVRCYECCFHYAYDEQEDYICPNSELRLSEDIENLEKLLKQIEGNLSA